MTYPRGRSGWPLIVVLLVLAVSSGGCGRRPGAGSQLDIVCRLQPQTPGVGPATLTVTVRDPSGGPVRAAKVRLEAYMSHPGMAPVLADGTERAPGVYDTPFAFTMQGDWVLLVSVALPDGARAERRIDVPKVQSSR